MNEPSPAPEPRRRAAPRAERPPAIPGYLIEAVLGRGTSGVVYRARQLAVERDVALKVLHPELSRDARAVRRLQREARTTARLAHPGVVSAIDMGEVEGRWWFAMELVDGPSLAERLRTDGRLSEREALRLFIPLCEALEHLWENGVVHRDVKPANILIDRTGLARLADLGLAFADDDPALTAPGGTLGTPHYISPEQAVDPKAADVQSDLWSIGATLFHAVCGQPPFAGTSAAEILSGVLYERVPDPRALAPELSKGLALVLRKCLVRDPRRRYATPRELRLDLERVRERRAPGVRRARLDPVRRERGPAFLWLAGLAALLAAGWGARALLRGPAAGVLGARPEERAAWDPVADLARRLDRGEPPGLLHDELVTQRRALADEGEDARAAADALVERLRARLASAVLRLTRELDQELAARVEALDLSGARDLLVRDAPARLRLLVGVHGGDLPGVGSAFDAWTQRAANGLDARVQAERARLAAGLAQARRERLARADAEQAAGEWDRALALLRPDDASILAALPPPRARFAEDTLEEHLAGERLAFRLRRQRLEDEWRLVDAGLRRFVEERAAALSAEEAAGARSLEPEGDPAARLREAFDAELAARGLEQGRMPAALERTSLVALDAQAAALGALHERSLARGLQDELAEVGRIASGFARRREYETALALWRELGALVERRAAGAAAPAWAADLAREVALRTHEAETLLGLSQRVLETVRSLAGRRSDLRIGSIVYPQAQVEVEEPLAEKGFRVVGRPGRFFVRTLPAASFEDLAGLAPLAVQSAIDRVRLAAFRWAEGDSEGARAALEAGPVAVSEPWSALAAALRERTGAVLARRRSEDAERRDEATRQIEIVFDPERAHTTPLGVMLRIDELLEAYGDLPEVAARREDLLARRRSLDAEAALEASDLRVAYGPASLSFPGGERVQLAFAFDRAEAGLWRPGAWTSAAGAWAPPAETGSWQELARQDGPCLALGPPLDAGRGPLHVVLSIEEPQGATARAVVVSCLGVHVALVDGAAGGPRWLVGSEPLAAFLARAQAGEGEPAAGLLASGGRHELELTVTRRTGQVEVALDGRPLGTRSVPPPPPGADELALRAWGPVRLVRAVLEAER